MLVRGGQWPPFERLENMFVIAGLGNPTKEYDNTRHNIGFRLIDELADKNSITVGSLAHKAITGKGIVNGQKVILVKPVTYMNLSGESLRQIVDYYKIDPENELIVISDDINLPPGYIRVRPKGSAGGHNGLKNIIKMLGTEYFTRIRIGVGEKPARMDLADYVLGHFSKEDEVHMKEGINAALEAINLILEDNTEKAMNLYNKKVQKESSSEPEDKGI